MTVLEYLKDHIVFLDGGLGTLLQKEGLKPGERPELWGITHPEVVKRIHRDYFDAGSNIVMANTFGANPFHYSSEELRDVISAAVANVRAAAAESVNTEPKFVGLDIGSTGRLLKPYGDLDFEDAVAAFAETVRLGAEAGADLICIETMNDSYETKAALLAAKENCGLPVFVLNAYGADGKLMTGADPAAMTAMLEGLGADVIGTNCSLGPVQLRGVVGQLLENASVPVAFKPNAGLPKVVDGSTVFDVLPEEFAQEVAAQLKAGVRLAGGCCGTTPEYIRCLRKAAEGIAPMPLRDKKLSVVSSYTHAVRFGNAPVLIGERINPTGKKRFKQALIEHDIDYILGEGIKQQDRGVDVLDVNVGIPDIDETAMLAEVTAQLQGVCDAPLQLDTSNPQAMERALRIYNGKAMLNSVNGKEEVMSAVFPLVRKYGGLVVALTLDENGIPETAEGRVDIARRIIAKAAEYGIGPEDLIIDPLCMTVSADSRAALTTLEAVRRISTELHVHTSLGVSNVSFGLPSRDYINAGFFAAALENGLSAAIMNPYSFEMMKTVSVYRVLHGLDDNCGGYISFAQEDAAGQAAMMQAGTAETAAGSPDKSASGNAGAAGAAVTASGTGTSSGLADAVRRGLKESAASKARALIENEGREPLELVSGEIIPALNEVGEGFEKKTVYLPQLLMAAEAAQAAFAVIKEKMSTSASAAEGCQVVIATVKGDIHDIGKNIVKLLLENYGFRVSDLGKDVEPAAVLDEVLKLHAPLCGLSALMTTTVPAMEETIKLIHEKAPFCRVMVGGAVLTPEYAAKIGADAYSKDAMGAVRYAQSIETQ